MRAYADCVHCYLKQAVICMTIAGIDEDRQHKILFDLMDLIKTKDRGLTPAENSTELLLEVYKEIHNDDPYREAKKKSNELGLKLYPGLKKFLGGSENRLKDALKIAVSGNVIDLGINRDFDIDASLEHCFEKGFSLDHYEEFAQKLGETDELVVVGDNAGEIVFDRLLVEELAGMGKRVSYIVKGGPILNDATMEDALQAGLDKTAALITTGSNYLGAPLHRISPRARALLENAPLVISKGQANFETLEHEGMARGKVFFLLKIKCECVAKVAGAKFGDVVFFSRR